MTEQTLKLKVQDHRGFTLLSSGEGTSASLLYPAEYQPGDRIAIECAAPPSFCVAQLEDTLPETLLYLTRRENWYVIPQGEERIVFSPRSFTGTNHLLRVRLAEPEDLSGRRNLACNPYDRHGDNGIFPHARANVETRDEAMFSACNAIDGVRENISHGAWPYQSWGINRDPNAQWTLDFGRPVRVEELRLTLRADFPHDSWWTRGEVAFSDGTTETLTFTRTGQPQRFPLEPRTVTWLTLRNLRKAEDPSPYPALTQCEAWGYELPPQEEPAES